ncbi:DUF1622 domain-containing protein [Nodosilinea sp. LEGE 07298]|jgi:uncharacterized membrane protein|uniref:DUF1622 domain-containing protein n=1 Tax=Nodosilinea sp. LEGE 07298 TaxID=2777970 RepID=UPI0018817D2F|nr:DUF1622 domain-containing protein [Nodosilinea sp. LEGE 07298]MBE9114081.1 DUF1622 domain-containing protein [Nodosilinea sp. LEGE 07298]
MDIQLLGTNLADLVRALSGILISTCQLLAIFVISVGIIRALAIFLRSSLFKPQTTTAFQRSRLAMGYSFSLGLSFLVGASILKTMLSSQWEDIARLVIIIAVRTVLNLLLERAIRNSQAISDETLEIGTNGKEAAPEAAIANS